MTTIKDIARLSGYSIGTVSRVINNRQDVSDKARQIIEKVIEEQNFQPNSNAQLLKQTVPSNIAVLIKGTQNVFLEGILERIQEYLRTFGEYVSVSFLDELTNEVETAVQICAERNPKGVIFLGGNLHYFEQSFSRITVPSVLVTETGAELGFGNLSSFATDDAQGAYMAVDYLIRKGHRRIGVIGGSTDSEKGKIGTRRLQGAAERLRKSGLVFDPDKQYYPCRFSMKDGYEAAEKFLAGNPDITGIFALSDTVAVGVLRALSDHHIKVPEDMSLIGYDGIETVRYTVPRLATVRQDVDSLAKKTADDLLMRISYARKPVHEFVPFKVLAGESVAPPGKRRTGEPENLTNQEQKGSKAKAQK